jgi:hypothetical protein
MTDESVGEGLFGPNGREVGGLDLSPIKPKGRLDI